MGLQCDSLQSRAHPALSGAMQEVLPYLRLPDTSATNSRGDRRGEFLSLQSRLQVQTCEGMSRHLHSASKRVGVCETVSM